MRCPDCNKFVSLEMQDPEVSDLDVTVDSIEHGRAGAPPVDPSAEFQITGTVRIVRTCGECGNELKEATLDIEQMVELGENAELTAEDITPELLKRLEEEAPEVEAASVDIIEEGGGRYAKSYFGAEISFELKLGDKVLARVDWSDKVAASAMDELV